MADFLRPGNVALAGGILETFTGRVFGFGVWIGVFSHVLSPLTRHEELRHQRLEARREQQPHGRQRQTEQQECQRDLRRLHDKENLQRRHQAVEQAERHVEHDTVNDERRRQLDAERDAATDHMGCNLGEITEGLDVLDSIKAGDVMKTVEVFEEGK